MTTLHLMVGLPCSGKTTYAKELEIKDKSILLSPDAWHLKLYGQNYNAPEFGKQHDTIKTVLWEHAQNLLSLGTSVILDNGFWTRAERDYYREKAAELNVDFKLHFMDVPKEELFKRLEHRNSQASDEIWYLDPAYLEKWLKYLEPPKDEELSL